MSFESERNYSLQELKEMNRPPEEPARSRASALSKRSCIARYFFFFSPNV